MSEPSQPSELPSSSVALRNFSITVSYGLLTVEASGILASVAVQRMRRAARERRRARYGGGRLIIDAREQCLEA